MPPVPASAKFVLHMQLRQIENEWPVWVFPEVRNSGPNVWLYDPDRSVKATPLVIQRVGSPKDAPQSGVLVATRLSEQLVAWVQNGGRALLISRKDRGGLPE